MKIITFRKYTELISKLEQGLNRYPVFEEFAVEAGLYDTDKNISLAKKIYYLIQDDIEIPCKYIPCKWMDDNGKPQIMYTRVDSDDYDWLIKEYAVNGVYFYFNKSKTSRYVYIKPYDPITKKSISIYIHRLIWERHNDKIPLALNGKPMEIDHENLNKLDNTKKNLRLSTHKDNVNERPHKINKKTGRFESLKKI